MQKKHNKKICRCQCYNLMKCYFYSFLLNKSNKMKYYGSVLIYLLKNENKRIFCTIFNFLILVHHQQRGGKLNIVLLVHLKLFWVSNVDWSVLYITTNLNRLSFFIVVRLFLFFDVRLFIT